MYENCLQTTADRFKSAHSKEKYREEQHLHKNITWQMTYKVQIVYEKGL